MLEFPVEYFGPGISAVACSLTTLHLLWEYIGLNSLSFQGSVLEVNTFLETCPLHTMSNSFSFYGASHSEKLFL